MLVVTCFCRFFCFAIPFFCCAKCYAQIMKWNNLYPFFGDPSFFGLIFYRDPGVFSTCICAHLAHNIVFSVTKKKCIVSVPTLCAFWCWVLALQVVVWIIAFFCLRVYRVVRNIIVVMIWNLFYIFFIFVSSVKLIFLEL